MATGQAAVLAGQLRAVVAAHAGERAGDGELLGRFVERRDGEAFAALVRRHGSMVLGVARRLARGDAEDVFQATFLVLARRAASVRRRESVGSWLYGVAVRLARRAGTAAARRQAREGAAARAGRTPRGPADPSAEVSLREAREALDE